jgi:hypothetical protein
MKKIFLFQLLALVINVSFAQDARYDKIRREYPGKYHKEIREAKLAELDKLYRITVGTSKLNASYNKDGIELKDKDLRLVGLLYRGDKLDVSELIIIIRKDGAIVDSSNHSCGPNNKWKDFYIHLTDVVPSEKYRVDVYSATDKKLLDSREFYIRKSK